MENALGLQKQKSCFLPPFNKNSGEGTKPTNNKSTWQKTVSMIKKMEIHVLNMIIYYIILLQNVPDTSTSCAILILSFFLRTTFNAQALMLDTTLAITFHCKANHNNMYNYYKKKITIIQQIKQFVICQNKNLTKSL